MTTQTDSTPTVQLTEKVVPPFTALCFTTRTTLKDLSQYYGVVANQMRQEAQRLNLEVTGPVQWVYTGATGDLEKEFQLEIALPVSEAAGEPESFTFREFDSFRCVSYTHVGPWSDLMAVYDAFFAEFYRLGYQDGSHVREIYTVVDLDTPANNVTEIQVSLA
ncbi:GyrI-like domain-containing protein [Nibrella viscosa]